MRAKGFYWIKYGGRWQVAECIEWWPTISDGTHEMRWLLTGKKRERKDKEFDSILEFPVEIPEKFKMFYLLKDGSLSPIMDVTLNK